MNELHTPQAIDDKVSIQERILNVQTKIANYQTKIETAARSSAFTTINSKKSTS